MCCPSSSGLAKNEYAVLTTYVPHLDQMHTNLNGRFEVCAGCMPSTTTKTVYCRWEAED